MANLETTLAGNEVYPYSSYPMFNSPDELADALKDTGFDLLSTINNHSFDKSDLGVNRTLSTLKEKGFDTVGTRENANDDEYIIKDINNIKVGITSYSYGDVKDNNKYLNGIKISEECEDKMNIFDSLNVDKAFETITSTTNKMKDTDMQVVIVHWGIEYARNETYFQKQLAQKLCDAGVDIIIGSHPHGITSYSYGDVKDNNKYLNGIKISEECENKMNVFDSLSVDKAFETITSTTNKMKDTDMQVVILHWGIEYARNETDFQKQLAQKLCDAGVDIIIGSHPHVVEPVETITSSDGKSETLVIYSLGNYISNQRRETVGAYSGQKLKKLLVYLLG